MFWYEGKNNASGATAPSNLSSPPRAGLSNTTSSADLEQAALPKVSRHWRCLHQSESETDNRCFCHRSNEAADQHWRLANSWQREQSLTEPEVAAEIRPGQQSAQEDRWGEGAAEARARTARPERAAQVLQRHPEGDAVQEARGLCLALLRARRHRSLAVTRLPRHHQTPHGPEHGQSTHYWQTHTIKSDLVFRNWGRVVGWGLLCICRERWREESTPMLKALLQMFSWFFPTATNTTPPTWRLWHTPKSCRWALTFTTWWSEIGDFCAIIQFKLCLCASGCIWEEFCEDSRWANKHWTGSDGRFRQIGLDRGRRHPTCWVARTGGCRTGTFSHKCLAFFSVGNVTILTSTDY